MVAPVLGGLERDQFSTAGELPAAPEPHHPDRRIRQLGMRRLPQWQLVQMAVATRVVTGRNYGKRASSNSALLCGVGAVGLQERNQRKSETGLECN